MDFHDERFGLIREDSGSHGEGVEFWERIRIFVRRILGFRMTEFGFFRGGNGRSEDFGLLWGEIQIFMKKILDFREACGFSYGDPNFRKKEIFRFS